MSERVEIGTVYVDAGIVMIGDPCYSVTGDASHHIKTWSEFCDKTFASDLPYGTAEPHGRGLGLVVPTLYGDGSYPVYAELEGGRVARVTIDFAPPYDEEDDQ